MALQTKYITLDDFAQYFPDVNLRLALGSEENSLAFLKRIEDRLAVYLDSNFAKQIDYEYPRFTDFQKEHYKLALLEQCIYVFKNSDISVDSGYDTASGQIIDRAKLKQLAIAPNTIDHLRVCGLWNRHIRNRARGFIGW